MKRMLGAMMMVTADVLDAKKWQLEPKKEQCCSSKEQSEILGLIRAAENRSLWPNADPMPLRRNHN